MLVVVSPAKTLDFDTPSTTQAFSQPEFLSHSAELIERCVQLTPVQISKLMSISDQLAGLNAARFANWRPEFTQENAKQALLAFKGDVYTGLDAETLTPDQLDYAQSHLRMLSGLYGLLRPLDLMMAYRLEMGTKLDTHRGQTLYEFWGSLITDALNQALKAQGDDILVNLASNEYFKAVKAKAIQGRIITPVFKDCKNGQYKIISFYAKKARGLMAPYLIEQQSSDVEQLKQFRAEGYYFSDAESSGDTLVFLRDELK